MEPAVIIGVGLGASAVLAIGVWMARARSLAARAAAETDDGNTCAACGNTDLTHPAEGVYVCRCSFSGGPGLAAYAWKLKTDRIAAMSEAERAELLAKTETDARLKLMAARGDYESALHAFREGEAIVPMGSRGANQKTMLYEQVRELLPAAERYLLEAVGSVETARHIRRGEARMHSWYERLEGSRETALTVTGIQATHALREQLREVGDVLHGLEREFGDGA